MDKLTITHYIYAIAKLPLPPLIIFDTTADQELLQGLRFQYLACSLFLRQLRLGEFLPDELFTTEMKHHKPFARFWDSFLTLVIEVYLESTDEIIRSFRSPAELWFFCLLCRSQKFCDEMLGGNPKRRTKKNVILGGLKVCRQLDDLKIPIKGVMPNDPMIRVIAEGRAFASDPEFDERAYRPFIRAQRKYFTYMKGCDALQLGWIEVNGEPFITGQSKKLPQLSKRCIKNNQFC